MKRKHVFLAGVLLALIFILGTNLLSFQQSANDLYQAGILKKSGDGNLEEAIKLFQKIVDNFPDNRELASQALLQIGLCYDLLGEKKAEATFRKLIADYPDQKDTVQIAREKLALLSQKTEESSNNQGKLSLREVTSPYEDGWPEGGPSPNGQYFSFIDWDRGANLSLFAIKSEEVIPLTTYKQISQSWCSDPIWSRDGLKIAYTYHNTPDQKDEVHIIRITDKKDEIVYKNLEKKVVAIAGWSSDQKKLYVDIQYKNLNRSLGYISIDSGLLTEIEQLEKTIPNSTRVSPDGRYLGYHFRDENGNSNIQAISTDGKENNFLVEHPSRDLFLGWTPDRNHILFSSDRSGSNSIWLLPVSNGKSNGEPSMVHNITGNFSGYGFTSTGAFYFDESHSIKDVYTAKIDLDTGKILPAPERVEKANQGHSRTPFWSHDGKHLGYFFENGNIYSLKILSLKTGEIHEWLLDFSPAEYFQLPRWTDDGKQILAVGIKESGGGRFLFQVDAKNGHIEQTIDARNIHAFSHDASLIYRVENHRTRNWQEMQSTLYLHTKDGKEKQILKTQVGSRIGSLSLSPNKKWLRFSMRIQTEKESSLSWNIIPAEGGDILDLSKMFNIAGYFIWGSQENDIIFLKGNEQTDNIELWHISDFLKKTPPKKLELTMPGLRNISFHPDGKTIAFTSGRSQEEKFWVLENYLPPKKEK